MLDPFKDIGKSWKKLAPRLGCTYSDDPPIYDGEQMDFWKPPVLTFHHRNWIIEFTASPFFLGKYVVFIQSYYRAKQLFDVGLDGIDTLEHRLSKLSGPLNCFFEQSTKHKELIARLHPVKVFECSSGVPTVDRHYRVSSHDCGHPAFIFSDETVCKALIGAPKSSFRLSGHPGQSESTGFDGIIAMEFWGAKDYDRIQPLVRLYCAILDRLQTLDYIDSVWSKPSPVDLKNLEGPFL
jgi:hypothetical protein